jgi:DNA-binding CsgD family transcriptional regulator
MVAVKRWDKRPAGCSRRRCARTWWVGRSSGHGYGTPGARGCAASAARPRRGAPLRAADEAFDALGAVPWSERALRELRASGERIRRKHDARDRLTPQELQIAQLVAEGLTNREIGQRLFVSPRTVSTHLSRISPNSASPPVAS